MSMSTVPHIMYPPVRFAGGTSDNPTLDAAEEFIALVFRVPKTGTLNKIGWYCYAQSGTYTLKISLETVASTIGQPVATTNSGKTLYATGSESADITSLSTGINYTAINGTSGISVTAGDQIAATFRLTSASSASVRIAINTYGNTVLMMQPQGCQDHYSATYLGSAWSLYPHCPIIALEYSDGFTSSPFLIPPLYGNGSTSVSWNSGSNPDRRGIKFKVPYSCRLYGAMLYLDTDGDVDVILYDSDEYTVMSGFPITLTAAKRRYNGRYDHVIVFPTKPTITADTWYRLVALPKSTTDISTQYAYGLDDGAVSWLNQAPEGANLIYTTRNGAPSSGDHNWTDSNYKPMMAVIIDGVDFSSSGGGISRSRQVLN